ncbi:MAG: hypothetical protein AAGF94_14595 [Pseudomonadota bacterium]
MVESAFKASSFLVVCLLALTGTAVALDEVGATGSVVETSEETIALTPTEAAQEEWRRMVCDGLVSASFTDPSDVVRAPSGTLMPPSLHPMGFTDAWYAAIDDLEKARDDAEEAPETKPSTERSSPLKRYVAYAAAFGLPALGFFIIGKRRRRTGWFATYAVPLAFAVPIIASIAMLSATARAGVDGYLGDDIRLAGGSLDDWRSFLCDDNPDILLAAGGGFGTSTELVETLENPGIRRFPDLGSGGFPGPPSFFPLSTNFGGVTTTAGTSGGGGTTGTGGSGGSGGGGGGGNGGGPVPPPVPLPPTLWLMLTACGGMALGSVAARARRQAPPSSLL